MLNVSNVIEKKSEKDQKLYSVHAFSYMLFVTIFILISALLHLIWW